MTAFCASRLYVPSNRGNETKVRHPRFLKSADQASNEFRFVDHGTRVTGCRCCRTATAATGPAVAAGAATDSGDEPGAETNSFAADHVDCHVSFTSFLSRRPKPDPSQAELPAPDRRP